MDKFIPIDKQSKKKQKEFYAKQRGTWGTFNPVTRTVPNGKAYNRNKLKQEDRRSGRLSYGKQDGLPLFCIVVDRGGVWKLSNIRFTLSPLAS